MAVGNDWGTSNSRIIEDHIVHQNDDPNLGLVTYIPFIDVDAVNEVKTTGFEVSPNPVSDGMITLTLDEEMPSEVMIYNLNGQIVKSQKIDNKVNTINIEMLNNGVYFVYTKNKYYISLKKLIVE